MSDPFGERASVQHSVLQREFASNWRVWTRGAFSLALLTSCSSLSELVEQYLFLPCSALNTLATEQVCMSLEGLLLMSPRA